HPRIDPVLLPILQGGVKPGCRIVWIKFSRELKLLGGPSVISSVTEGFAGIAAYQRASRLQDRGRLQIQMPAFGIALPNPAQTTAKPGISEGWIDANRLIECLDGLVDP